MANQFIWYDVMTTDPQAAADFYAAVIGWTVTDSGMEGMTYLLLHAGADMVGGIMPIPPENAGMPPMWMGYIHVDDVDAMAVQVVEAGGTIHKAPQDIPGVGRFAVAGDPGGAGFILFQSTGGRDPMQGGPMMPGHFGWHELLAGDREAAFAFYSGLFGWQKGEGFDMGEPVGMYQTWSYDGGDTVGGMMTKWPDMPVPFWAYYISVADIHAATSAVTANGGTVMHGPHPVPGGAMILVGHDPQGAMFNLIGPGS